MIRCRNGFAGWVRRAAPALAAGVVSAVLAAAPAVPGERAASPDPERYPEKAAVLFELTRFVEWPPADPAAPDAPFVIGVLGDEPFSEVIRRAMAGKKVRGHVIRTRSFRNLDEFDPCSILVVGRAKARLLPVVLDFLAGTKGVLTVGETADFAALGGGVRLVELPDRIGFEINRDAARHAELRLSAQLLRLAERLLPEPDRKAAP